jgi:hypothetical protein
MIYNFNKYKNKIQARKDTILAMYQKIFNRISIPKTQHYITLCANQVEGNKIEDGSELKQVLDSKLLKSKNQFYGVDFDKNTIKLNKNIKGANWVCDDLHSFLTKNISKLQPAIINIDSVYFNKKKITELLSDVMLLLCEKNKRNCMVVVNFILNNPYNHSNQDMGFVESEIEEYHKNLVNNIFYTYSMNNGWKQYPKHYIYSSTGKAYMASYIYYFI